MNSDVTGISLKICDDTLVIRSQKELRVLSSAALNGGLTTSKTIINHHVPRRFHTLAPERYLRQVVRNKGLQQNTVGLMTAADMRNISIVNTNQRKSPFSVAVTAGTSNAMAAGDDPKRFREVGTINAIILLDSNPTDACLVEIVKTVTEAKALALRQLDILSRASNHVATGTSTDTVTVAATRRGKPLRFAGTATIFGTAISRNVVRAVKDAIEKQDGITADRSLEERLKEREITFEIVMKALSRRLPAKIPIRSRRRLLRRSRTTIRRALESADIASLILSFLKICEDSSTNTTSARVARELGSSIAYLIGGKTGRLEFQKACSSCKRPLSDYVFEGIVTGVLQDTLRETRLNA